MEMLDILKGRLPDGLEIVKVKNRSGNSQTEILFSYEGTEAKGWLPKTCTPGRAENCCDFLTYGVMAQIGLQRGDLVMAKGWLDKQQGLCTLEG